VTVAERRDLFEVARELTAGAIPEYNYHGDTLNRYWPRLEEELPDCQFLLLDEDQEIVARGHSIPLRWDGTSEDLPAGIDGAIARGFDEPGANTLCALLIVIPFNRQGRGSSASALEAMQAIAGRRGLARVIAPVRPNWKERYPLVPIERYAAWRREDGLLFDPWLRVHERLGATVLKPEPKSLRITGPAADWERWTGMAFPESGTYWFPHGLAPLEIDRESNLGTYWEPNVWMAHPL